jgi:predicted nucleic acid-binding Zn ribbon protein
VRDDGVSPDPSGSEDVDTDGASVTPLSTSDGGKAPRTVDSGPKAGPNARNRPRVSPVAGTGPVDNPAGPGEPADVEPAVPAAEEELVGDVDIALSALSDARQMAGGRFRRRDRDAARRTRRENLSGRNRGGYSGPGPDSATDPQRIGDLLGGYVEERGWQRPLAHARVFAEWPALVGQDVADHCTPQSLVDGELRITAESTAWATQLRLLGGTVLARLVAELGADVVRKLNFTGPTAPSWKHGNRSVRGSRGPRDTYG